ncbi:MAG: hypothetical protein ABDH28_02300 [Brevinematia bacterium]
MVKVLSNVVTFNYDYFDDVVHWGCCDAMVGVSDAVGSVNGGASMGGSLARFSIIDNYLYALRYGYAIKVFELSDPTNPKVVKIFSLTNGIPYSLSTLE